MTKKKTEATADKRRLTIYLPADLATQLAVVAAARGMSMSDLMEQAAVDYLEATGGVAAAVEGLE